MAHLQALGSLFQEPIAPELISVSPEPLWLPSLLARLRAGQHFTSLLLFPNLACLDSSVCMFREMLVPCNVKADRSCRLLLYLRAACRMKPRHSATF